MERLTEKAVGCFEYALKDHKAVPGEFGTYEAFFDYSMAVKRLGHYEDTGLEPDEIYEVRFLIAAQRDPQKLARLRELVLADEAGRLVVLPCKVGDTVYVIDPGDYKHDYKPYVRPKTVREISWKATSRKDLGWGLILAGGDCGTSARYKLSNVGKTVFLTREEAEAALAGKGGEG